MTPSPLHVLRDEAASADAIARVQARLESHSTQPQLRRLPGVRPGAEARVRARLAGDRRPVWQPALALAAAALLAVGVWGALPDPDPLPVDQPLAAAPVTLGAFVALTPGGQGRALGTEAAPRIEWEQGTLNVEVTPDQGVDLKIQTREALVEVVGTGFDVDRSRLGTRVDVDHGAVRVTCTGQAPQTLTDGQSHLCLPTTAAASLDRARALSETDGALALAETRRGQAMDADVTVRSELQLLELELLLAQGDTALALDVARDMLGTESLHQTQVRELAAKLALTIEGCDAATTLAGPLDDASIAKQDVQARCAL
jgi:ferric-dicitrate binding protein FerR (iron transport regulator)